MERVLYLDDILVQIFNWLDYKSFLNCREVCQHWGRLGEDKCFDKKRERHLYCKQIIHECNGYLTHYKKYFLEKDKWDYVVGISDGFFAGVIREKELLDHNNIITPHYILLQLCQFTSSEPLKKIKNVYQKENKMWKRMCRSGGWKYGPIRLSNKINDFYRYDRTSHVRQILNNITSYEVPYDIYTLVKNRTEKMEELDPKIIRMVLKKMGLNRYYEHIPEILRRLKNEKPIKISREDRNRILQIFSQIVRIHEILHPRTNFPNHNLVIRGILQILGLTELMQYFSTLRSTQKMNYFESQWVVMKRLLGDFSKSQYELDHV